MIGLLQGFLDQSNHGILSKTQLDCLAHLNGCVFPDTESFYQLIHFFCYLPHTPLQRLVQAFTAKTGPMSKFKMTRDIPLQNVPQPNKDLWNRVRKRVMLLANIEKFSQNAALKKFLLQTERKLLIEATSDRDQRRIPKADSSWGNGDWDGRQYPGTNYLGRCLMAVRANLQKSSHAELFVRDYMENTPGELTQAPSGATPTPAGAFSSALISQRCS